MADFALRTASPLPARACFDRLVEITKQGRVVGGSVGWIRSSERSAGVRTASGCAASGGRSAKHLSASSDWYRHRRETPSDRGLVALAVPI